MRTSAPRSLALALAALVALGACGRKGDDTAATAGATTGTVGGDVAPGAATPAPAPAAPAPGAPTTALAVGDVKLGRSINADNTVKDGTDDFKPNDTIYAVVETDGPANGQSLVARWTYQDGQVVEETTQPVNSAGEKARTVFRITKPSGWPKGDYKVAILLNGQELKSEDFSVK